MCSPQMREEVARLQENIARAEQLAKEYKHELDTSNERNNQVLVMRCWMWGVKLIYLTPQLESGVEQALLAVDAKYIDMLQEKQATVILLQF